MRSKLSDGKLQAVKKVVLTRIEIHAEMGYLLEER